jgi:hypothetical protein
MRLGAAPPVVTWRTRPRSTSIQVVRGSRVVAREFLSLGYQAPKQPGPRALQRALQLFGP